MCHSSLSLCLCVWLFLTTPLLAALLIRPIWGWRQQKLFSAYQDNGTTKCLLMYSIWLSGFHRYALCIIQLRILLLFLSHDSLVSSFEIYGFFYYQDDVPQVRKLFLSKVHQYIKERALDAKYACAFLLAMDDYHAPQYEEVHTLNSKN
jgi:hypothetical protein